MGKRKKSVSPDTLVKRLSNYLDAGLADLLVKVSATIPRLGVTLTPVSGRYWFFHPGWFNLRLRWGEIIHHGESVRELIVKAHSLYVHQRGLRDVLSSNAAQYPGLSTLLEPYSSRIVGDGIQSLEEASSRLFALREKIACLLYEFVSAACNSYIPAHRVGYPTVLSELRRVRDESPSEYSSLVQALHRAAQGLENEDVIELRKFRNAFIHGVVPKLDQQTPPLFIATGRSSWDSTIMDRPRTRQLVHLVSHVWRAFVRATRAIAREDIPSKDFRLDILADSDLSQPNEIDGLHTGVAVETQYGLVAISCMKRCKGFKAVIDIKRNFDMRNPEIAKRITDEVFDVMKSIIPETEPEKTTGHVRHMVFSEAEGGGHLAQFLTTEPLPGRSGDTFVDRGIDIVRDQIEDPEMEGQWVPFTRQLLDEIAPTSEWPDVAKAAYYNMALGKAPGHAVVREDIPEEMVEKFLIFRPDPKAMSKLSEGRKGPSALPIGLMIFGQTERWEQSD